MKKIKNGLLYLYMSVRVYASVCVMLCMYSCVCVCMYICMCGGTLRKYDYRFFCRLSRGY